MVTTTMITMVLTFGGGNDIGDGVDDDDGDDDESNLCHLVQV